MSAQQGNRFEWKALLLNQSVHIGHNARKRVLFERRTGKKNQILRSRLRRISGPLDRKRLDIGK